MRRTASARSGFANTTRTYTSAAPDAARAAPRSPLLEEPDEQRPALRLNQRVLSQDLVEWLTAGAPDFSSLPACAFILVQ